MAKLLLGLIRTTTHEYHSGCLPLSFEDRLEKTSDVSEDELQVSWSNDLLEPDNPGDGFLGRFLLDTCPCDVTCVELLLMASQTAEHQLLVFNYRLGRVMPCLVG